MANTSDIKNGLCINHNGKLAQIIEFQHVKPGKGGAFVRTKMRSVLSGKVVEKTFNAGTRNEKKVTVKLFPWEETNAVGAVKATFGLA